MRHLDEFEVLHGKANRLARIDVQFDLACSVLQRLRLPADLDVRAVVAAGRITGFLMSGKAFDAVARVNPAKAARPPFSSEKFDVHPPVLVADDGRGRFGSRQNHIRRAKRCLDKYHQHHARKSAA